MIDWTTCMARGLCCSAMLLLLADDARARQSAEGPNSRCEQYYSRKLNEAEHVLLGVVVLNPVLYSNGYLGEIVRRSGLDPDVFPLFSEEEPLWPPSVLPDGSIAVRSIQTFRSSGDPVPAQFVASIARSEAMILPEGEAMILYLRGDSGELRVVENGVVRSKPATPFQEIMQSGGLHALEASHVREFCDGVARP